MTNLDVTVVVPIYNKLDYIDSLINTISSQSNLPNEVILIDDFSNDGSYEKLLALDLDKRYKIIRNDKNLGVSKTRNKAIKLASNNIICLLDCDDYWHQDFIKITYNIMKAYDCDLLGVGYAFESERGLKAAKAPPSYRLSNKPQQVDNFYSFSLIYDLPFTCSSVVMNKERFLSLGGFPENITMGEDQVLWSKFTQKNSNSYIINDVLSYYRLNVTNSACKKKYIEGWSDYIRLLYNDNTIYYDFYISKLLIYYCFFIYQDSVNNKEELRNIVKKINRAYIRFFLGALANLIVIIKYKR